MTGPMLDRLEVLCRSTAAKWECEVMEFNDEADHDRPAGDSAASPPLNRYAVTGGALRRILVGRDVSPRMRLT